MFCVFSISIFALVKRQKIEVMGKVKGEIVESEPLAIEDYKRLLECLSLDKMYLLELYCRLSFCTALRISDVLSLTWADILYKDIICKVEHKTQKTRLIKVGDTNKKRFIELYELLRRPDLNKAVIRHPKKEEAYTARQMNRILKRLRNKYHLPISRISTHTLRKTFGKYVYEKEGKTGSALVLLSKIFNHSSIAITRRYIGLNQEQINDVYASIDF